MKDTDEIKIMIAENLKRERLKRKLTQKQLGEKLGTTQQQIAKYENAVSEMSAATLYNMEKALRIREGTLLKAPPRATKEDC